MRRNLQVAAVIVLLAATVFWAVSGANRGWSKNQIPKKTVDDVTGIESVAWENKFVPGVDFLGAALAGAGLLVGASFLVRNKKTGT